MKILLYLMLLDVVYGFGLTQPQHAALTQQAAVACWTTESSYHLKFLLVKNDDTIEAVYTVNNQNASDVSLGRFDSAGNGITGNGTPENPFVFEITATGDLPNIPIQCAAADIEDKNTRVEGSDVLVLDVMAKSRFISGIDHTITFAEDVLYQAACNFSDVKPLVISTGSLTVDGSVNEGSKPATEVVTLEILKGGSPTTQVALGDNIQLSVKVAEPTSATGVYVHSCYVCNTDDCGSVFLEFVDSRGCSDFVSSFLPGTGVSAATEPFSIFTFAGQNSMVFRCKANFCYDNSDTRCYNYCAYNGGRKKRQVEGSEPESSDRDVWTRLVIDTRSVIRENLDDEGAEEQKSDAIAKVKASTLDMDVMLAVIILAGLLLIALIVSCVVFFCLTSRRRNKEQGNNAHS